MLDRQQKILVCLGVIELYNQGINSTVILEISCPEQTKDTMIYVFNELSRHLGVKLQDYIEIVMLDVSEQISWANDVTQLRCIKLLTETIAEAIFTLLGYTEGIIITPNTHDMNHLLDILGGKIERGEHDLDPTKEKPRRELDNNYYI